METLLLTIYTLVVFYVLYQMSLSLEDMLEDKVEVFIHEKDLQAQTQSQLDTQKQNRMTARFRMMGFGKDKKKQVKRPVLVLVYDADKKIPLDPGNKMVQEKLGLSDELFQEFLHDKIQIRVSPTNEMTLKKIMFLTVAVTNDTSNAQVYINWDHSSIESFGQGNRVVRNTPNVKVDLSQAQVMTVINPGMTVTSNITTENAYARNEAGLVGATPQPIADLKERLEMAKPTDPTSGEENIQHLYTLDLMMGLKPRNAPDSQMVTLLIPFVFKMRIKVDKPAFPPMRWWLRNFGRRKTKKGNWFWGSRPKGERG